MTMTSHKNLEVNHRYCDLLRRPNVESPGKLPTSEPGEKPFVTWNHVIKQGLWCLPCCIIDLDGNRHPKMNLCSSLPTKEEVCKQQNLHGCCGLDFNP